MGMRLLLSLMMVVKIQPFSFKLEDHREKVMDSSVYFLLHIVKSYCIPSR